MGDKLIQNNSRRYEFDTVALLRSELSGQFLQDGEQVSLLGHTVAGIGGGTLYWDKTSTATDDDDTVFKLTDTTTGRFIKLQKTLYASSFGFLPSASAAINSAALQAAATYGKSFSVQDGTYEVDNEANLASNQTVTLGAGVRINQNTANKSIFKADTTIGTYIELNGALLYGEGSWSAAWTGNSGHLDRVISFTNCTHCSVNNGRIQNGAYAGLYLEACTNFKSTGLNIEGTHTHGVALSASNNFQNGIYIKHSSDNGDCKDLSFDSIEVSGTAQGVLGEVHGTYSGTQNSMVFSGMNVHDIPGQHGMYMQSGDISIQGVFRDCALDGVKFQSPNSGVDMSNIRIDANVSGCNSHAVEIQNATDSTDDASTAAAFLTDTSKSYTVNALVGLTLFNETDGSSTVITANTATTVTGVLSGGSADLWNSGDAYRLRARIINVNIDLVAEDCSRGLGLNNDCINITANVLATNTAQQAFIMQGGGHRDVDIRVRSNGSARDAVELLHFDSSGTRISPIIRDPASSATYDGFKIGSTCTETGIKIYNPIITDAGTNMRYGIFNESTTASFNVLGGSEITGFATAIIRNDGPETIDARQVDTLADNPTPNVWLGRVFLTGGTTTITDFDEGSVGQTIRILAKHSITITDNANIVLNGGANYVMTSGDALVLTQYESGVWTEDGRSVN